MFEIAGRVIGVLVATEDPANEITVDVIVGCAIDVVTACDGVLDVVIACAGILDVAIGRSVLMTSKPRSRVFPGAGMISHAMFKLSMSSLVSLRSNVSDGHNSQSVKD